MATPGQYGLFIASTNVWEIDQLGSQDISPELKKLLVRLYQDVNKISIALNLKDTGYYNTQDYVCGQLYFPNPLAAQGTSLATQFRQVIRKVINFGALPNAGTKSVPHAILVNAGYSFTRIYATATKPTATFAYVPIPYASNTANGSIELDVDDTNVNITTAQDWTAYTKTYVVLEYLSQ